MKPYTALLITTLVLLVNTQARANLIAYYNFDEKSGSIAHDSVGSVNGTLFGNATFAPGAGINGGGAVDFNQSTNDFISMGNNFNFSTTSFSIEAWVKTSPGDTGPGIAISNHWATHVAGYFLGIGNTGDASGLLPGAAHFYATYPISGQSATLVNDGQWHQLVGVYNNVNDTVSIYVDGTLQDFSTGAANPLTPAQAPFVVGGLQMSDGTLGGFFNGLITDVGVYNSALTNSDISSLYHNTLNSTVPEPSTFALLSLGGLGLVLHAFRHRLPIRVATHS